MKGSCNLVKVDEMPQSRTARSVAHSILAGEAEGHIELEALATSYLLEFNNCTELCTQLTEARRKVIELEQMEVTDMVPRSRIDVMERELSDLKEEMNRRGELARVEVNRLQEEIEALSQP